MGDQMYVTASTTLPDWCPVEVWSDGFDAEVELERMQERGFEPPEWFTRDPDRSAWDLLLEALEGLAAIWVNCEETMEREKTLDGRDLYVAGHYNYGVSGFADSVGFEAACQAAGMSYIAADDGGSYENGTYRTWSPDGGLVEMQADSEGDPMVTALEVKRWNDMTDAEVGAHIRALFGVKREEAVDADGS